jgi:esterase/lipase superfamily enzyme
MSNEKDPEPIIDRLVMAAPDVDAQAFSGRYIESLEEAVSSATLYFSSSDRALWLSRLLHGGKRVGLDVVTRNVGNLEAVDIGPQAFFSTGHSYYGSDPVVIDDLSALLRQHAAAPQRPWLTPQRVASAEFWLLDRQRHAEATTAIRR